MALCSPNGFCEDCEFSLNARSQDQPRKSLTATLAEALNLYPFIEMCEHVHKAKTFYYTYWWSRI